MHFEKASLKHKAMIFDWLAEPHMQAFWDNSDEHKNDILNFINGKKQTYFLGTTKYWIGYEEDQPFCFILSDQIHATESNLSPLHKKNLSQKGHTIALDFGIGNKYFLGKGLAAATLQNFILFYKINVDPKADTFFIDPDKNNPRALHVYQKAGFELLGEFTVTEGAFKESKSILLIKRC